MRPRHQAAEPPAIRHENDIPRWTGSYRSCKFGIASASSLKKKEASTTMDRCHDPPREQHTNEECAMRTESRISSTEPLDDRGIRDRRLRDLAWQLV
jgi:hypothetical protein